MKYVTKALICSLAAFVLIAGSISAQPLTPQPVTTNFALQSTIVNPLIKLKVGWSTWIGMEGSRVVLVSAEGGVRLESSGRVVGLQPGNATVYKCR
ncbi:hypothetical protein WJ0W_002071 [Paenibacillus melissococcoides]|uniref:Uncharacterized protein n=1 Tax=Paenibacillus melissococcoides TaxID=2912268 RepID=A0ABM9FZZ9_9BACL|nr:MULTISPECIES: hypothetical protein [Paenibacillus]MEB9892604.1 hypothetical protein [Bacillus cereus]CAH8244840.1 hypothetical protein WJ0W_002071 [Paenibacillus melissococcoides]CAH8709132.1 hypothetical protein WDD9_002153 [Paenibacillus melissococcoides]CAH8709888.1 hypothetical protein HTL2_002441 [Paenibacillus melissococcoides]GIO82397.1 hypothetical protein J6TS7_60070 [Paenibacillus dendritiformis]